MPAPDGMRITNEVEIRFWDRKKKEVLSTIGPLATTKEPANQNLRWVPLPNAKVGVKSDLCVENGDEAFIDLVMDVS